MENHVYFNHLMEGQMNSKIQDFFSSKEAKKLSMKIQD